MRGKFTASAAAAALAGCAALFCGGLSPAAAEPYPRITAADGTVIAHKSGEQAQFVDTDLWREVEVDQDLLAGDMLRTNALGNLTIRFSDKTLVRMGRNSTLLVKKINSADDSVLGLSAGQIWARAARGGSALTIDTPAATAAIRGTDWTLRVDGAHTTLTVLEGAVELRNAQGTVLVKQGEGATATLGQAPRKYTLVNLKEREQLLLYNELRGAFSSLSPSRLDGRQIRAERLRILALGPAARWPEDWLTLAEAAVTISGRAEARAALTHLRRPLDRAYEARARLVEAMLAGQDTHYAEAAQLFAQALPALPKDRRAAAAYGLWFARSLAEPDKSFPPPRSRDYAGDPVSVLAEAQAIAHQDGPAKAIALLEQAEKRFPGDVRLPATRAALALQLDRRDEVKAALARAEALDPDDPSYLLTKAQFRTTISSDLDGALADLTHASEVAPGADDVWNEIGLVQSDRNAIVEADRAYRRAIGLNPENPALHANYARFLLDNDQVDAAGREIETAEKLDPSSYAVLAAKGRYLLRLGRTAEGEKALLDASAVNPTYGDALIGLAIASYQQDAGDETRQALDNADRFDPNNPSVPLIRSGIALDQYLADEAIRQAREALRRRELRGGYYSGYDANRQATSFLGITLENLGLEEWGQYYSDRAYDPFRATTYLDEAASGRLTPFVGLPVTALNRYQPGTSTAASELQGLILDPLAVASEQRRNSLERRSFFEAALGGSVLDEGAGPGWGSNIELQGTNYRGLPLSYDIQGQIDRPREARDNDGNDLTGGLVRLGIRPTLFDNVLFFANTFHQLTAYPGQTFNPTPFSQDDTTGTTVGGAWSHTIEDRNVIQAFAVANETDTQEQFRHTDIAADGTEIDRLISQHYTDRYFTFGLSHLVGLGPVTLRYGAEATQLDSSVSQVITRMDTGAIEDRYSFSGDNFATRSYADATLDVSRDLQFEAGAYLVRFDGAAGPWGPVDARFGAAWSPVGGHWLRAVYRQDTQMISNYTLSPISTVGLAPLDLPIGASGQMRSAILRWDAEWNDRFFTTVEYQHQSFNGLSLSPEDLLTTFITSKGELDRLNLSSNVWIGGGLGAFSSLTLNHSKDLTPGWSDDFAVPLVPDYVVQVGFKYVHPSRITAVIAQNFVGRRIGSQYYNDKGNPKAPVLDRYTTTDAALTWTSENRAVEWGLEVTNIFDEPVEMADSIPAPGRTIRAAFKARF